MTLCSEQRGDFGLTLHGLARTSKINLCQFSPSRLNAAGPLPDPIDVHAMLHEPFRELTDVALIVPSFDAPHIREVQFVQCKDPVKELASGKVDLVTDVPDDRLAVLQAPRSTAEALPPLPSEML